MKFKYWKLSSLLIASSFLVACGGEGDSGPASSDEAPETEASSSEMEVPAEPAEFVIEASDNMMYNLNRMEAVSGQTVRVTLKNVGTMPVEQMGHNWTLLKAGVDAAAYGGKAMLQKDNGYQVPGSEDVIVNTSMLGPGEEETVEFTAPAPGIYKYVCTFPGHYGSMKGTFIVK